MEENNNIQNFENWIKTIAIYLGQFETVVSHKTKIKDNEIKISSLEQYDDIILKKYRENNKYNDYDIWLKQVPFVCVSSNHGNSNSPYVKSIVENIFPAWQISSGTIFNTIWHFFYEEKISYNCNISPFSPMITIFDDSSFERHFEEFIKRDEPFYWRDDLKIESEYNQKFFEYAVKKLYVLYQTHGNFYAWYYSIFWNLFLLAIDDEIYDKQISDVMSLAQKVGFDEAMMRDWCRAVEYVMAGNMFSEYCDFQCETYEGKIFFLHQE